MCPLVGLVVEQAVAGAALRTSPAVQPYRESYLQLWQATQPWDVLRCRAPGVRVSAAEDEVGVEAEARERDRLRSEPRNG